MTEMTHSWSRSTTPDAPGPDSVLLPWARVVAVGTRRLAILLGLPQSGGR